MKDERDPDITNHYDAISDATEASVSRMLDDFRNEFKVTHRRAIPTVNSLPSCNRKFRLMEKARRVTRPKRDK